MSFKQKDRTALFSFTEYAKEVFALEAKAILNLQEQLDDNFDAVIHLLLKTTGRLVVTGIGKSGLIGRKMAATFASTGMPSFFLHPAEAFHGDLGMVTSEDVVLALSKSGETTELLELIPYFQKQRIPIIGISAVGDSTLIRNAQFFLKVAVDQEACPLDLAPTTSSTAMLAMGDALAMALMRAKEFQPADFAQFHPGGSLGRRLLTEVRTVMYRQKLPIIHPTTSMGSLIDVMTASKLGLVVIQENQQIIGIITDGDLRRIMKQRQYEFFDLVASDFMTRNPVLVAPNCKMQEAADLMKQKKITSLLVAEYQQLIGVVQIYQVT
ncbi:MAG: KpsF/GutQ family sugar-phosphate isomerase [Bacteroidota bacterium]